jgi:ethanolamine utilization protein EutQ
MKKLICAEDIETLQKEGKKSLLITKKTIITPSAKDLAEAYQIVFHKQTEPEEKIAWPDHETISKEGLVSLLRQLLHDAGTNIFSEAPFTFEKHTSGLKIIHGSTVKLQPLFKENPNVCYQELITPAESQMSGGILEIEKSSFYEEKTLESINYVIEGKLQLTIDGTTYMATKGDTIFIPKNHTVRWSTPDKVTILCGKLKGVDKQ